MPHEEQQEVKFKIVWQLPKRVVLLSPDPLSLGVGVWLARIVLALGEVGPRQLVGGEK